MSTDWKKYLLTFGIVLLSGTGLFYSGLLVRSYEIINKAGAHLGLTDPSSTRLCDATTRPFSVMVSSDTEARPLSGLRQADLVFEMPVTDSGVTRMMAVFACQQPKEIGSIRSARLDFIPLAQGLQTIYAHWGGEHQALLQLNNHAIDNVDGIKYEGTTYYRKTRVPRPHNGFTDFALLQSFAIKHNYDLAPRAYPYFFGKDDKSIDRISPPTIFRGDFSVEWRYDSTKNEYIRHRGNNPEIDALDNDTVRAKNVLIMRTSWAPISKDYIRVQTIGEGELTLYQNGASISGRWKKTTETDPLLFVDIKGEPLQLVRGSTWVEIDAGL